MDAEPALDPATLREDAILQRVLSEEITDPSIHIMAGGRRSAEAAFTLARLEKLIGPL